MKQATLLVKALAGFEGEEKAEFEAALKSADKAMADKLEEMGSADVDGDMTDPESKLDAMTKAYAAEHNVPYFKAQAAVIKTEAGKDLYKETMKKEK